MISPQLDRMQAQLILHEGLRTSPYKDTLGNWTLGVGYNVTSRGLYFFQQTIDRVLPSDLSKVVVTEAECRAVLAADIQRVEKATILLWPYYQKLDPIRQRVVIDCGFNMGITALGFKKCIACIEAAPPDWSGAAMNLYNSKWRTQVEPDPKIWGRADRLCQMLLTGQDYTH